ncbi:DNA invertase Pin-like site-specific DNA recombinase [Ureibacillus xyleni]|uniref:DNA invertase Pin-like site-specific DNA recombinase n=1 Tax=Ureibacillus xyleni TaxID=614648 RepID=A0A285TR32_9BACL|nr:recombinase family protein [Ureibacillus xyleni]SOC23432.1 DNA invertase Pin-like site-specific DNA recombinase [Ureibacillus xyleni]
MIYGYVRPLYNDKQCLNQLNSLKTACEKIFQEEHGAPKKRKELESLLMQLRSGDIIIVQRMFALADTTSHLFELLKLCERDQVTIQFLQEGIETKGTLPFNLTELVKEFLNFQSDIVKQSTTLGIAHAKEQGKSIGRPKKSDDNVKRAISMYYSGDYTLLEIKNETGISKSTLYRYLEAVEEKE